MLIRSIVDESIRRAVAYAIGDGLSVETFLARVREHWRTELREKARSDDKAFDREPPEYFSQHKPAP